MGPARACASAQPRSRSRPVLRRFQRLNILPQRDATQPLFADSARAVCANQERGAGIRMMRYDARPHRPAQRRGPRRHAAATALSPARCCEICARRCEAARSSAPHARRKDAAAPAEKMRRASSAFPAEFTARSFIQNSTDARHPPAVHAARHACVAEARRVDAVFTAGPPEIEWKTPTHSQHRYSLQPYKNRR